MLVWEIIAPVVNVFKLYSTAIRIPAHRFFSLDGGELFDRLLQFNFDPTELDVVVYMKQICEAVAYLHKNQILHLDLKPGLKGPISKSYLLISRKHSLCFTRQPSHKTYRFWTLEALYPASKTSSEFWNTGVRFTRSSELQLCIIRVRHVERRCYNIHSGFR